jgi:predicted nucleic acid-binding protein
VIVLEASVLIAHLEASDVHHDRATALLIDAVDEPLGVSPLTLAEVFVGPARSGQLDVAQIAVHELGIATIALSDDAPARLAAMRASTRLRLPDCCVLLAAETAQACVATFDDRLASSAAHLGLAVRS